MSSDGLAVGPQAVATRLVSCRPSATLALAGELDLAAVPAVRDRLCGLGGDVDLDCSGLTFIDASGLRLFVAVHHGCERRGAKMVIVNPAQCVLRLLAVTGLDSVLTVRRVSSTR